MSDFFEPPPPPPRPAEHRQPEWHMHRELDDDVLRFGIRFADGSKATIFDAPTTARAGRAAASGRSGSVELRRDVDEVA